MSNKCHKTHDLRDFCVQVSQIVFLADLTVLRIMYNCMKENCHKTHICASSCAQVSQNVFLADLTVFSA